MAALRVVSLFSGCGGADLGFEGDIVFANEIDEWACKSYEHWYGVEPWSFPLQRTPSDMIPDCDVILGGPPCQSFSNARSGKGQRDMSGLHLVKEMQRVVTAKRPKVFVCENAPTLLDQSMATAAYVFKHGWPGYEVKFYKLSAEDFGVPQNRVRFFVVGTRSDLFAKGLRIVPNPTGHWSKTYHGWADYLGLEEKGIWCRRGSSRDGRFPDEAAYTVMASELPVIRYCAAGTVSGKLTSLQRQLLGVKQRYVTVWELLKLQGFPEEFKLFGPKPEQIRQVGNAWCGAISMEIARVIKEKLG